jgi:hypothetical protein
MKRKLRAIPQHFFVFKTDEEEPKIFRIPVQVTRARRAVELHLTAADVEKSIEAKGIGNTQRCSMAICAKRHKSAFPHHVEGFIDWQYSRAYVVSKVSKTNGLPTHCVVYQHQSKIAHLNDSPGGQKKLLAILKAEGDKTILLMPMGPRATKSAPKGTPEGRYDGSREKKHLGHGAKARFAFAQLGGAA